MRWLAAVVLAAGCRNAAGAGPYATEGGSQRNTFRAQELNARAADLIESDAKAAEELLREALSADLFFGPAHNNLGVLFLEQGKLYEAAEQFEWARKLMPGHPDPRMNLALTLEEAGRIDEAIQNYRTALEVYPGHVPTTQALARLHVQTERKDEELTGWLDAVALRGETVEWREWAERERARQRE